MKKWKFWLFVLILLCVVLFVLFSTRLPAQESIDLSKFPESGAKNVLRTIHANLRAIGVDMKLLEFHTVDVNIDASRVKILYHSALLVSTPDMQKIYSYEALKNGGLNLDEVMSSIKNKLEKGDFVIEIELHLKDGDHVKTSFGVSEDGTRTIGYFIEGSRLLQSTALPKPAAGNLCELHVLSRYLTGRAAETLEACIEHLCSNNQMQQCTVTKVVSNAGFSAKIQLRTEPSIIPGPGNVIKNRCAVGVSYAYSTGLQKISVAPLEVEGTIGQGALGNFTVSSGCWHPHQ